MTVSSAPTASASSWAGALLPSLSDFFFIALLVWLFVGGGGKSLLGDGDTGWHIRTGDYILATHAVPRADIFSFTKPNEPWFAWEWLADIIFSKLHLTWGVRGVAFLAGVLICSMATVLFCHMLWSGGNLFFSLTVALAANCACLVHFLARPHVFTFFLLATSLWIIARDRKERDRTHLVAGPHNGGLGEPARWICGGDRLPRPDGRGLWARLAIQPRRGGSGGLVAVHAGRRGFDARDPGQPVRLPFAPATSSATLHSSFITDTVQKFQSPSFLARTCCSLSSCCSPAFRRFGSPVGEEKVRRSPADYLLGAGRAYFRAACSDFCNRGVADSGLAVHGRLELLYQRPVGELDRRHSARSGK